MNTRFRIGALHITGVAVVASAAVVLGSIGVYAFANRPAPQFPWPLPHGDNRPMLLNYGMYVTPDPDQNPIDPPERFIGYHTGQDFEIRKGEENEDVPVSAICNGKILIKQAYTQGYGGLVTQHCDIHGEPAVVVYGHLDLSGMTKIVGDTLAAGEPFAKLGAAKSKETDDNRKHLHLTIHKGERSVILGYVQTPEELDAFIDPITILGR